MALYKTRNFSVLMGIVFGFYALIYSFKDHVGYSVTGSVPVGFYQIGKHQTLSTLQRGEYFSFCLPKAVADVGLKAGYLQAGRCPSGSEPLLKQVIALPGDHVQLTDQAIIVNGMRYPAPRLLFDNTGQKILHRVPYGSCVARKVWVYGSGDFVHSWDSRYYGGITPEILNKMTPLWVF